MTSRGTPTIGHCGPEKGRTRDQRPTDTSKFVFFHQDSVGVSLISDLDFDDIDIYRHM